MFFTLEANSEADAFATEEDARGELARMLANTARDLTLGLSVGILTDYQGNRAGEWNFEPRSEEDVELEQARITDESLAAVSNAVSMLSPGQCVKLLEGADENYKNEGEHILGLQDAVEANVLDGTLSQADVLDALAG